MDIDINLMSFFEWAKTLLSQAHIPPKYALQALIKTGADVTAKGYDGLRCIGLLPMEI